MLVAVTLVFAIDGLIQAVLMLAALSAALGVLARLRPIRWVWRKLVIDPFTGWFRREIGEVVDERLNARAILNGKGLKMAQQVEKIAEKAGVE